MKRYVRTLRGKVYLTLQKYFTNIVIVCITLTQYVLNCLQSFDLSCGSCELLCNEERAMYVCDLKSSVRYTTKK